MIMILMDGVIHSFYMLAGVNPIKDGASPMCRFMFCSWFYYNEFLSVDEKFNMECY